MLKLSKKVEYGILALQYLADREGKLITAKEVAEDLNISFEFLSKTLQTLMKKGLINSQQGIKGGYFLSQDAKAITLSDIVASLESKPRLVDCATIHGKDSIHENCERLENCTIRTPLMAIQDKIDEIFKTTTLADLRSENINEQQLVSLEFKKN